MQRWLQLALSVWAGTMHCDAQIGLLTLGESEEILETLPQFRASEARGECPAFDILDRDTSRRFSLQVRGFCPPAGFAGSTTVGNFVVDRSTGAVAGWASGQPVSEPPAMKALATALVAQAVARVLSEREAQCLAREAARGEVGPGELLSVTRGAGTTDHELEFVARYRIVEPAVATAWNIWVDASSVLCLRALTARAFTPWELTGLSPGC
jgi:hypothetical protein